MVKCIALLYLFVMCVQCARILVVLPSTFYSHQQPLKQIYKELSLRGHQVVAITTSPFGNNSLTNLMEINLSYVSHHVQNVTFAKSYAGRGIYTSYYRFLKGLGDLAEDIFADVKVQQLLNDGKEYFDLVIIEWCAHPVFAVLSQRFKCPLIGFRSMELRPMCHESIGNPINPSYIPSGSKDVWTGFWSRLDNFLVYLGHLFLHKFVMLPRAQTILDKHIKNYSFDVENAESNVSIVITNTHPILNGVRPVVPNYIQISGLHIQSSDESKLPKDVKNFLDNATKGVIYLSFGSVVHMGDLVGKQLLVLIKALNKLPYKTLCKLEGDNFTNFKNIKFVKWIPQRAVLAHKNVKLFMTHGGLLSYQEAIHYKVPLVGSPFYGDQFVNVNRMIDLQIGKRLDFYSLDEETATSVIKEVVENPLYKARISVISDMIKHQAKMPPMDETMWWIEYVLNHNGAQHLKSAALNLNIFQYLLLDVISFLLISALVIATFIFKTIVLLRLCINCYLQEKKKSKKE